jgi:hypothetical protein
MGRVCQQDQSAGELVQPNRTLTGQDYSLAPVTPADNAKLIFISPFLIAKDFKD